MPDGSTKGLNFRAIELTFSEPIDESTITANSVRLVGPSGDETLDRALFRKDGKIVQLVFQQLEAGAYQVIVDGTVVADRAGNVLGGEVIATTFNVANFGETVAECNSVDSPYVLNAYGSTPAPVVVDSGGANGNVLRLTTGGVLRQLGTIGFDEAIGGPYSRIELDFDYRMFGSSRSDGIGVSLLDSRTYGDTGSAPAGLIEEGILSDATASAALKAAYPSPFPSQANGLSFGFDVYKNINGEVTNPDDINNNHINIRNNNEFLTQFDPGFDLVSTVFQRAKVVLVQYTTGVYATMTLTPLGGSPVTVLSDY